MPYDNPIETLHQNIFFPGVAHEQPWSSIVWLLWGFSFVSSGFLGMKIFQNDFLRSFAIAFVFFSFLAPFFCIFQNV